MLELSVVIFFTIIITFIGSLVFIYIGVIDGDLGLFISIAIMFVLLDIYTVVLYLSFPNYHIYKKVKRLFEENDENQLIKLVETKDKKASVFAIYALYDLQSSELPSLLKDFKPNIRQYFLFNQFLKQIHKDSFEEIYY